MRQKKCYLLGIDIETGGHILGQHPLLAIGFYMWNGSDRLELLDTCEIHLEGGDIESYDTDTLKWWQQQKEAWEIIKKDTINQKLQPKS